MLPMGWTPPVPESPRSELPPPSPPDPNGCGAVVPTPGPTKLPGPKVLPPDEVWLLGNALPVVEEVADVLLSPVPPLLLKLVSWCWASVMVRSSHAIQGAASAKPTNPKTRRIGPSIAPHPRPLGAFADDSGGISTLSRVPGPRSIGYYPENGPQ